MTEDSVTRLKMVEKPIRQCIDCPHSVFYRMKWEYRCGSVDIPKERVVEAQEGIPEWCPLPDFKAAGK